MARPAIRSARRGARGARASTAHPATARGLANWKRLSGGMGGDSIWTLTRCKGNADLDGVKLFNLTVSRSSDSGRHGEAEGQLSPRRPAGGADRGGGGDAG